MKKRVIEITGIQLNRAWAETALMSSLVVTVGPAGPSHTLSNLTWIYSENGVAHISRSHPSKQATIVAGLTPYHQSERALILIYQAGQQCALRKSIT